MPSRQFLANSPDHRIRLCERLALHKLDDLTVEFFRLIHHRQMAAALDEMHVQGRFHFRQRSEPFGSVTPIIFGIKIELWKRSPRKAFPQRGIASVPVRFRLSGFEKTRKVFPGAHAVSQLNEFISNERLVKEISFE